MSPIREPVPQVVEGIERIDARLRPPQQDCFQRGDPQACHGHQNRRQRRCRPDGDPDQPMPERQQPKPQEEETRRQRRQVDQAADQPRKDDEDELTSQGGPVDRPFWRRHLRSLGGRSASLFAGRQRRAVRKQRLIVEAGVVAHPHVEAEGRMRAHETSAANVDMPDSEIAILDGRHAFACRGRCSCHLRSTRGPRLKRAPNRARIFVRPWPP